MSNAASKSGISHRMPISDPRLLFGMHVWPGIEHINKFGSIVDATSNTTEDLWDGGGTYVFPVSTADMSHVSQTTDQVAARGSTWTLEGLDTNFNEITQNVTLDGTNTTTPVALTTPLLRINRMFMISPDITLTSTVRLHNAAETIDYADIQVDHNQTLNAIYTIPAGVTGYITGIFADYVPTATKNPDGVHFHLQARRNADSQPWRVIESFGIPANSAAFTREFGAYSHLPEKTDIRMTVLPQGKDAHAHGSFDIILLENSHYGNPFSEG